MGSAIDYDNVLFKSIDKKQRYHTRTKGKDRASLNESDMANHRIEHDPFKSDREDMMIQAFRKTEFYTDLMEQACLNTDWDEDSTQPQYFTQKEMFKRGNLVKLTDYPEDQ